MLLVADTNVLFSFFNRKSRARELSTLPELSIRSPKFALEEIKDHKSDIINVFSLSKAQFSLIMKMLDNMFVKFIPLREYVKLFEEAMNISPDPDDVDFFALALKMDCPVWSNDSHFMMQSGIKVFKTEDLVELLL